MCLCGKGCGGVGWNGGSGENGVWEEWCRWSSQGWGGLGSFLPTAFTAFHHQETVLRSVQPRENSFSRRQRCLQWSLGAPVFHTFGSQSLFSLALLHSGASCIEGYSGETTSFLLFGSVLGSFITAQPSQQVLGKNEIIFRNLLIIGNNWKEWIRHIFFGKSSRSECTDL